MAVQNQQGGFPPPDLDWPQSIPPPGPASAAVACYDGDVTEHCRRPGGVLRTTGAIQAVLWRTKAQFARHNTIRGDFMIHKEARPGVCT